MFYAIDASVYVFRAWFSVPDDMVDPAGNPVNALYGFSRFLADFVEEVEPDNIVVAFDRALESSFRNDIYPEYKANRDPAPPELERQFRQCMRFTEALGLRAVSSSRYEADDIIGTSVTTARQAGSPATIVSRDKDLVQLVSGDDVFWDFAGRKRLAYNDVPEAYGVWPEQIPDFLALAGDSVDNIPGVPGVGKKTAAALLAHFGSLNVIYSNLDRVAEVNVRGAAKLGARLEEHRDICDLSRQLTGIVCDAPLDLDMPSMRRAAPKIGEIYAFCDEVGFGTGLRLQAQRIADNVTLTAAL
ncbi:MAG: 5'-3' exonuclease H3TH domain-containing protein [Pseudomonadota bacterium]